jgi:hypothetical protein
MSDQPKGVEPVPVQLTRMEGVLNLVAYQVGDLGARMERVEQRVSSVELAQATNSGASASWKAWLPTVIAALAVLAALGFGINFGG